MSVVGSPIETSLLQAAQAQQVASKARDREKAAQDSAAKRFQDMVELRVAGIETAEAIRKLPRNDSEEAGSEHRAHDPRNARSPHKDMADGEATHVDVQA